MTARDLTPESNSPSELRAALHDALRAGTARWIRMNGLSLDDGRTHAALCQVLARLGIGADVPELPRVAVLDWCGVEKVCAEGLALFGVLLRNLIDRGVGTIVCGPAPGPTVEILAQSRGDSARSEVRWIREAVSRESQPHSLADLTYFNAVEDGYIGAFCDDLSASLKKLNCSRNLRTLLMGTTQEVLHNVLSHSRATHAMVTAVLLPRRRPAVVQIGVADDGIGIRGAMLLDGRHEWLTWFHDLNVTETVLHQKLSGRPNGSGGGMGRIIGLLLEQTNSSVFLRSGAALIVLRSEQSRGYRRTALTYGAGTQVRIEVRIS